MKEEIEPKTLSPNMKELWFDVHLIATFNAFLL